jgi:hypothetical protein
MNASSMWHSDLRDDVCILLALGYPHSVHMCLYEWWRSGMDSVPERCLSATFLSTRGCTCTSIACSNTVTTHNLLALIYSQCGEK